MKFKVTTEQSEHLQNEVSYLLTCGISADNDYPSWEIKSEFIQRLFSSFVQTEEYQKMDLDRKKDMLEYYFKLEKMLNVFDAIDVFLAKNFAQDAIDYIQYILFPKPTAA
jgi:hypothetical protein